MARSAAAARISVRNEPRYELPRATAVDARALRILPPEPPARLTDPIRTPVLRWAGGKAKIVKQLLKHVPADYADRRYWEPFVGAGSLFFALSPVDAVLGDTNADLMHCYTTIRDKPEWVFTAMEKLRRKTSRKHYYAVRDAYNRSRAFTTPQAARFLYLNRLCFNGIFRVNQQDEFNVPYGGNPKKYMPTLEELQSASEALQAAKLRTCSFERLLANAEREDFIYLDPPYPPLNETAFFTSYTSKGFGSTDQHRVARAAQRLADRGCKVMVSNADTPAIRAMYPGWYVSDVLVTRFVSCKKEKIRVGEVLLTNYPTQN